MQAITTKFLSPTDTRGSRIKASCPAGRITISYPYEVDGEQEAHTEAAKALIQKLGWTSNGYGKWFVGATESGYVFVASGREGIGEGSDYVYQIRP